MIALILSLVGQESMTRLHDLSPDYSRTQYEAACGGHVFRITFYNGSGRHTPEYPRGERGRVLEVTIDGAPLGGAVSTFQSWLAGRFVYRLGIMTCGLDANNPIFQGALRTTEIESNLYGLKPNLYFRIRRENGEWRIVYE